MSALSSLESVVPFFDAALSFLDKVVAIVFSLFFGE
jgi:hypothetical protein